MANNKIKFPLWLTPECKQVVEDNYRPDQCQSRSEFIEKAIWFYAGFLHTLDAGAYLPRALKQMLDGTLGVFAERIGRQLFKLAVEQNVNNHILASDTDIDSQSYPDSAVAVIEDTEDQAIHGVFVLIIADIIDAVQLENM